jgi:hypothetical protein
MEGFISLHIMALAAAVVVHGIIRLAIVCRALRGAPPEQVPAILRALPGIFRGDWILGSTSRKNPAQTSDKNPLTQDPEPD